MGDLVTELIGQKVAMVARVIYSFNIVFIKIALTFFTEVEKTIL